jgi:hypothetical protein
MYAAYVLAIMVGLRRGEIVGLHDARHGCPSLLVVAGPDFNRLPSSAVKRPGA